MSVPAQPESPGPIVWKGRPLGDAGPDSVAVVNIRDITGYGSVRVASCQVDAAQRPNDSMLLRAGDVVVTTRGARLAAGVIAPESAHGTDDIAWPEDATCGVPSPQIAVLRYELKWHARVACAWINSSHGQASLAPPGAAGSQPVVVSLGALRDLDMPVIHDLCVMEFADAWDSARRMHEEAEAMLAQQALVLDAMFDLAHEIAGTA